MPRLFISHSSTDNIAALAFQRWLMGKGWGQDDIFIDLHDMQAGEKWRETLVKANVACDALLFLASPEALDSDECKREVRRAEDDRKDVIVAILRDLTLDDPRLKPWMDRQIMDLSAELREERVEVEHKSRRHFVDFNRLALEAIHAKLIDWGHAPDSFAWPPKERPNAQPYPGLDAFDELSAGIFFGREADIMGGIRDLRHMRHRGSPRLMVIQAASGAGKSSFLRAGLWPKLSRTSEFVPLAIVRPAKGAISGPQGLGKGLEEWFGRHRIRRSAGAINAALMAGDARAGAAKLAGFMTEAAMTFTEAQSFAAEGSRPHQRKSVLLAIDQGEELFAAEDAAESERLIAMLGHLLAHPPEELDPYVLMTIRADSVDPLLQRVPALGIDAPHMRPLPPLSPSAYRDVITKPAAVYTRRVARLDIEPELVDVLVSKATGADALPLLAFTLQRMFDMYHKEQRLTVADYEAMGGIEGSIDRALAEAQKVAGSAGSQDNLRRLLIPALATWDPVANGAKRLVPSEAEVIGGDRSHLAPLASALVEKRLLTRGAGTFEVAHEALLRRPLIDTWVQEQKDALKLRDDVLREAFEWSRAGKNPESLVRWGARLESALELRDNNEFSLGLAPALEYLESCRRIERSIETAKTRRRRRTISATMAGLFVAASVAAYLAWITSVKNARMLERAVTGSSNFVREAIRANTERGLPTSETITFVHAAYDMLQSVRSVGNSSDSVMRVITSVEMVLADSYEQVNDLEQQAKLADAALEQMKMLAQGRQDPTFRRDLARAYWTKGRSISVKGRNTEALGQFEKCLTETSVLSDDVLLSVPGLASIVATCHREIGLINLERNLYAEAFEHVQRSLALAKASLERNSNTRILQDLTSSYLLKAELHRNRQDFDEARNTVNEALALLQAAENKNPELPIKRFQGDLYVVMGDVSLFQADQVADKAALYEQARADFMRGNTVHKILSNRPDVSAANAWAYSLIKVADVSARQKDYHYARQAYETAKSAVEEPLTYAPDQLQLRRTLNYALAGLSDVLTMLGQRDEAIEYALERIENDQIIVAADPNSEQRQRSLADGHYYVAQMYEANAQPELAL
ncbi:MAG: TIR domain-containing protein, partial [Hyphomicrobiales bacterium]